MGTRRLKAEIDFDVTGESELKGAARDLRDVGKAGKEASPGLDNAAKSTGGLGGSIKSLVAGGLLLEGGRQLIQFGQASITAASDVEEMQSKFNTVFKDLSGSVTNELQAFADAANRSVFDLQGFAATLQDTFVPLGFARDEAAATSVEIVKLAEDLASFNNLQTGDVVRDLQSALVGNTETLRKYGVVANQSAIDAEALALGLDFTKGSMDAQTKAAAILSLTMKGTTDAQGDAIRTADSYANTQKGLEAATTDLKVAIGEGLLPIMTELSTATAGNVNAIAGLVRQKNILSQAVARGIITQADFLNLQAEAALTSKTLEELTADYADELERVNAKTAESNLNYEKSINLTQELASADAVLLTHTNDIADAHEAAQLEIRDYHQELAAAAGPNEELSDKIAQTNNMLDAEATALAEARGELNQLTGEIEAGAGPMENMVSLTDRINERLAALGNRHDFLLSLDVEGLEGLQEAIDLAGGFMNENIDPLAPQGDRDFGDQFDPSAAFDDPNFAAGTGGQFLQVPGPTGAPFPVVLHGGESFNVVPAGESPGGGGASNNVSISQIFNGPVDPGMVQSETEAALAEAGIRGF